MEAGADDRRRRGWYPAPSSGGRYCAAVARGAGGGGNDAVVGIPLCNVAMGGAGAVQDDMIAAPPPPPASTRISPGSGCSESSSLPIRPRSLLWSIVKNAGFHVISNSCDTERITKIRMQQLKDVYLPFHLPAVSENDSN
mmetsp:Transcript_13590/g.39626  ORF Transcript_13590/g.39626 Transcript_13590/m.39626 type:complete len:140 (-) Transcript_13590:268-687(-)